MGYDRQPTGGNNGKERFLENEARLYGKEFRVMEYSSSNFFRLILYCSSVKFPLSSASSGVSDSISFSIASSIMLSSLLRSTPQK